MSRHNAYLKDENLLTLFSLNNMIVPEIQREYVWGNNRDVLDKFLTELESKAAPCEACHHVHTSKNINVGFLYSYKPSYVKYESERILDEYLIDGQQRITTLFLLLLYRAAIEGRMDDFTSICRADENDFEMGFNYKVRSLTQQFLVQLIQHAKAEGPNVFDFISDLDNTPYWFLDDYKNDPSITAMVSALESIQEIFGSRENFYFDYLLTNIHFWHFKTEATSQGEELYITMNSRGEQLTDNEMQKARKLPSDALLTYGKDWEDWQTYFWRKRKEGGADNQNADKGFNNFLACIENLESFNGHSADISSIKKYIDSLKYICSNDFKEELSRTYQGLYIGWFDSFIDCLWKEINKYDGKWDIIDPRGGDQSRRNDYKNKSIARNNSMLFWSWMTYMKNCKDNGIAIDNELLIKLLHFYYIRYRCYKRSSTSIDKVVECFINTKGRIHTQSTDFNDDEEEDNVNSRIFSEEEILLSSFSNSKELESLIWEIQELPYFIDGKGVGGNTVYELFSDNDIIDNKNLLDSLTQFKERITDMLGYDITEEAHPELKRILLFYEHENQAYWKQQSPYYYTNYETCNWRRIVRSKHFINFYKEFIKKGMNHNEFLEYKRKEFFAQEEHRVISRNDKPWNHRELIILYDLLSENGIWDEENEHKNVALWNNLDSDSSNDIFKAQSTIWKAWRYYDKENQVTLLHNWRDILTNEYNVQIIE